MCAQNVQNIKFASFPLIFSAVEVGKEKEAKFCYSLFTEQYYCILYSVLQCTYTYNIYRNLAVVICVLYTLVQCTLYRRAVGEISENYFLGYV